MIKTSLFLLALCCGALTGCAEKNEPVSNAATEYADSLRQRHSKAQEAADKANRAIEESQKRLKALEAVSE